VVFKLVLNICIVQAHQLFFMVFSDFWCQLREAQKRRGDFFCQWKNI